MNHIFDKNGLISWNSHEICIREFLQKSLEIIVSDALMDINKAFKMVRIETPILTPLQIMRNNNYSSEYKEEDLFSINKEDFILRPETTLGTYEYFIKNLLDSSNILPICLFQYGKSFRSEQDKTLKNVRLKEFYQQEFQCFYSKSSKADYQSSVSSFLLPKLENILHLEMRLTESDRLPNYSLKTLDIEVNLGDRWMEIASISIRKDFTEYTHPKCQDIMVLELAFGLDRLVYCFNRYYQSE